MQDSADMTVQESAEVAVPEDKITRTSDSPANPVLLALGQWGFTPLGLAMVVLLLVLPLIPPFNQEHILRWLVSAALIGAQAIAFDCLRTGMNCASSSSRSVSFSSNNLAPRSSCSR